MNHPDPKKHQFISFIKSAWRIVAGGALCFHSNDVILLAGISIIIAEILGIIEELV